MPDAPHAQRPSRPVTRPVTRRGLGVVVRVAGVLVACALLLWGADALARVGAQSLVARQVQDATGTSAAPEVHVRGALFLPQLVRGRYDEVDVTTRDVTSGSLTIARVDSVLTGVALPFHDVLLRDVRGLTIDRSTQHARLTYRAVDRYLHATGRPLTLAPAEDGQVQVSGTLSVLGSSIDVSGDVSLSASDGQLQVTPRSTDTGSSGLDSASRALLGQRLTFAVPLQSLPFGHHLAAVDPGSSAIAVTAVSTDVRVEE